MVILPIPILFTPLYAPTDITSSLLDLLFLASVPSDNNLK